MPCLSRLVHSVKGHTQELVLSDLFGEGIEGIFSTQFFHYC